MNASKLLDGQRVLVSGAAQPRGIGRAIATLFADHGARVACLDVAPSDAPDARLLCTHADLRDAASCQAAVDQVLAAFGGLDVLVNNAGIVGATRIWDLEEDEFVRMVDINLNGAYRLTRAALPALLDSGRSPTIVNIGSMAAMRGGGLLGGAHYASSKGGLLSFTKALARELGPRGVRANAIAPGIIETDMTIGKFDPAWESGLKGGIPLARFGTAAEVAKTALFLASDLSSYCTGAVIDVNGGFHIH